MALVKNEGGGRAKPRGSKRKTTTVLLPAIDTAIDRAVLNNPTVIILCAVLIRVCVGLYPHSGQNDPPRYGDFEAQRHWLEVTYALPLKDWYVNSSDNDLQYWGLDYPPLTAYVSWIFAAIADALAPEIVALHASRGMETAQVRAYMRATVLFCDLVVYFSATWLFCKSFYSSNVKVNNNQPGFVIYSRDYIPDLKLKSRRQSLKEKHNQKARNLFKASSDHNLLRQRRHSLDANHPQEVSRGSKGRLAVALISEIFLLNLLQPGLILIDHGHFQYNSFSLGLGIWMVYFVLCDQPVLASIAFCLALNFKQTSLYYAPAVFFFLLSRSLRVHSGSAKRFIPAITVEGVWNVAKLGVTVIACFGLLWLPFCIGEGLNRRLLPSCLTAWQHILERVFPFHRGVFEDKVANVWCSIDSLGVIKFKKHFSQQRMALICLVATLLSILPSCIDLFRKKPSQKKLLWALFNCSLSFFLFSFQVHEKSILWPLMPIALLAGDAPGPSCWFSMIAVFRDKLLLPYTLLTLVYCLNNLLCFGKELLILPLPWLQKDRYGTRMVNVSWGLVVLVAIVIGLQVLHLFVPPPARYPDLWVVLISTFSSGFFCLAWLYGNWFQMMLPEDDSATTTATPPQPFPDKPKLHTD